MDKFYILNTTTPQNLQHVLVDKTPYLFATIVHCVPSILRPCKSKLSETKLEDFFFSTEHSSNDVSKRDIARAKTCIKDMLAALRSRTHTPTITSEASLDMLQEKQTHSLGLLFLEKDTHAAHRFPVYVSFSSPVHTLYL